MYNPYPRAGYETAGKSRKCNLLFLRGGEGAKVLQLTFLEVPKPSKYQHVTSCLGIASCSF